MFLEQRIARPLHGSDSGVGPARCVFVIEVVRFLYGVLGKGAVQGQETKTPVPSSIRSKKLVSCLVFVLLCPGVSSQALQCIQVVTP